MHSPPKYKGLLGVDNHGDRLWVSEVNASEGIPAEVPLDEGPAPAGGSENTQLSKREPECVRMCPACHPGYQGLLTGQINIVS